MHSFFSIITGRLFWKIFLWFWLTTIIMVFGGALGAAYLFKDELGAIPKQLEHRIDRRMDHLAGGLRYGGEERAKSLLKNSKLRKIGKPFIDPRRPSPPQFYIINEHAQDLLDREIDFMSISELKSLFHINSNKHQDIESDVENKIENYSESNPIAKYRLVTAKNNKNYLIIIKNPDWTSVFSRLFLRFTSGSAIPLTHLMLAIGFSIMVCFWLSWYLTRPIHILRQASRELASGKLDYKVVEKIGSRRDEIADLSIDFDHMAGRLQTLLNSQKQLLNDTSHELRSPLARLQIAVSLAEKKAGDISELELLRIVTEINRLDELIGQILTVSRLESQAHYSLDDYIDIADLLKSVINDAQFEANYQHKKVNLQCCFQGIIKSNAGLLHRAFDNLIRNAMHHTHENTQVEVILKFLTDEKNISIKVCDQGDGVPEEKLSQLFEPFFRVDDSRERSQGGYGLGLAIAKRAIRLHGGSIEAYNQNSHGLCVEVILPINSEQ